MPVRLKNGIRQQNVAMTKSSKYYFSLGRAAFFDQKCGVIARELICTSNGALFVPTRPVLTIFLLILIDVCFPTTGTKKWQSQQ